MTGQNDRQDRSLPGQVRDQAGHCPLPGRYLQPCSPYPGKVNFLVLDIDLGRAFLRTLGHQNQFSAKSCAVLKQADVELWTDTTITLQTFDVPVCAWSEDTQ